MKFDALMDALAKNARQERAPAQSPRDAVLRRLGGVGGGAEDEADRPLLWTVILSGLAACASAALFLDAYAVLTDPLGMFIDALVSLPLEM